jgi:drug/metabolite transporter (DMT)-like permease
MNKKLDLKATTGVMKRRADMQETSDTVAKRILTYAGVWFAVLVWGLSFVAARFLLHPVTEGQATLSPTVLAAARFSLASMFFVVPLARALLQRQIARRDLLRMVLLGQIAFSLYFWLQYTGVQLTNASISSILVVGLIPVVTALLAQLLGKERLSWTTLGALLCGFIGVIIIVFQRSLTVTFASGFLFGAVCLIGNAFAFAAYSTLSKRWMQRVSPLVMTGGTMISGAVGLVLLSLLDPLKNRWSEVAQLDGIQWMALLFLSVVCSVMAYFAYNIALTKIDASRVAVYIYFEPVVAVLFGVTLLGEPLNWQVVAGAVMIAGAVVIVNLIQRRKAGDFWD